MKKLTQILLILIIFNSCAEKHKGEKKTSLLSQFISISENEDKGVKEVLNFYGGECRYSLGASASSTEGKGKYFELEMSKSELLEGYSKIVEMPASNIAYLFYKNLVEEKEKYDFIRVNIEFENGENAEFDYPRNELEIVKQKMEILDSASNLMKLYQYKSLLAMVEEKLSAQINEQQIENTCRQLDSVYGKIDSLQFQGFKFMEVGNVETLGELKLTSVQIRQKQNTPLSVTIDPGRSIEYRPILSIKFEL